MSPYQLHCLFYAYNNVGVLKCGIFLLEYFLGLVIPENDEDNKENPLSFVVLVRSLAGSALRKKIYEKRTELCVWIAMTQN